LLIIFDLDDTLINTSKYIKPAMLKRAFNSMLENGLELEDEKNAIKYFKELSKNSDTFKINLKKFIEYFRIDFKFFDIAYKTYISDFDDSLKILTFPYTKNVLNYLSKNHTLAIVTMGYEKFQQHKIEKAGIDRSLFCKIMVSEDGNKEICYKSLLDENSFDFNECIVCGDKIENDLKPAKKLGFKTVLKKSFVEKKLKDEAVDFEITDLREIIKIVENKV